MRRKRRRTKKRRKRRKRVWMWMWMWEKGGQGGQVGHGRVGKGGGQRIGGRKGREDKGDAGIIGFQERESVHGEFNFPDVRHQTSVIVKVESGR